MSELIFKSSPSLTIGVEMELQILDPNTWDLKAGAIEILDNVSRENSKIKPEFFQSMLEINTDICRNAHEVEADLKATVEKLFWLYHPLEIHLASNGTHPFARYDKTRVFPRQRYFELIDRNQWIAQRMVIFGLHIHLGMCDGDHCIKMMKCFLHYLHLLLAISASSPFWEGADTGLASSRITVFEAMPTAGRPAPVHTWREFVTLYEQLIRCEGIRSIKDLWWDLRPSPHFGTLEIRICDGLTTIRETAALVALVHAMAVYFERRLKEGFPVAPPPEWILRENKWRASRHGLEAKIIVDDTGKLVPVREQIAHIMEQVADIEKEYAYTEMFQILRLLVAAGGSHSRQRRIFEATASLARVAESNSRAFGMNNPNAPIVF